MFDEEDEYRYVEEVLTDFEVLLDEDDRDWSNIFNTEAGNDE